MHIGSIQGTYDSYYSGRNRVNSSESRSYENQQTQENENLKVTQEHLSEADKKKVDELKKRDKEVRQHEQSHKNAAGGIAGPPQYEFKTGPDGRQYATGGHVSIDTSKGRTPEETIQKAQKIRRAALAPKEPSSADRKVAQEATRMENEARAEIAQKKAEGLKAYGMSINNDESDKQEENVNIADTISNKERSKGYETGYSGGGPKRLDSSWGEVSVPLYNQLA